MATLAIAGCRDTQAQALQVKDPFAFVELRRRAAAIEAMGTPRVNARMTIEVLQSGIPEVARLYREALSHFDGIYGQGVGPAKGAPEYVGCIRSFHEVDVVIRAPSSQAEADPRGLWTQLQACRVIATRWAGPAEMATFGNDLEAMADGAMMALSYAVTAKGLPLGPEMYRQSVRVSKRIY